MRLKGFYVGIICAVTAISLCGCNDDGKSNSEEKTDTTVSFVQNSIDPIEEKIPSEIASSTFEGLGEMNIYSDCSNEFFSVIYAKNTLSIPDGIYSSPNVSATVNGKAVELERLAYIIVSGDSINMSVSFNGGFVEKGSEICVTVENFNKLREAVDEDDFVDYDEYTDEAVLEGRLEIKATTNVSFGNFCFDFSDDERLVVGNSGASFENALKTLGEKPNVEQLVLVTKAGTEVKFDKVYDNHYCDEEGNLLEDYTATFFFDDDRRIDLGEIEDIKLCGESLIR